MFGQSLLSAFGSAACTTDTDQLFITNVQTTSVATYQFNNATTSIPNNTYPGAASNITYAAGKFGNAAVFNGSNSYISLGTVLNSNIYTYSFWVNPVTTTPSGLQELIGSASPDISYYQGTSGELVIYDGSQYRTSVNNMFVGGTWVHVCIVANNTTLNVYKNGANVSTQTITGNNIDSLVIGKHPRFSLEYFNGSIDQVRIFNSALQQSAVTALYNETTTTATYDYVEYEAPNPNSIAYYKMSDATDQLGNYNGTATNVNFSTEGKFGFAGAFNGTSSKINTGYIQTGQVYSASFWGKGFSAGGSILRDTPAAGGANTFMDIATGANGQVIIGGNVALAPSYTPSTDWTHYAVVLDGTNATIYENGSQIATKTYTAKTGNNGTPVHMMSNGAYFAGFSGGYLDQVRIYDSALSAANVTALYNEIECPAVAVTNAFNTVIYTGDGNDNRSITGVGFEPDFIWLKNSSNNWGHTLVDSVRGLNAANVYGALASDQTAAETTTNPFGAIKTLDTDGFTIKDGTDVNGYYAVNRLNSDYVAWNWKAGGAAVSGSSSQATSVTMSPNPDAGFSIVKFTASNSTSQPPPMNYISHGLNAAPEMVIYKRTNGAQSWVVQHDGITTNGAINLDLTNAQSGPFTYDFFDNDATNIGVRSNYAISRGESYIAYCFHSVDGYSKIGSYTGTGATGNVQYVGFKPSFILLKNTSSGTNGDGWFMLDTTLSGSDVINVNLQANTSDAESGPYAYTFTVSNTGFEPTGSFANFTGTNASGNTYIFLAIA